MIETNNKNSTRSIVSWFPAALLIGFLLVVGLVLGVYLVTRGQTGSVAIGTASGAACCSQPAPAPAPCDSKDPAGCLAPLPCFVWVVPLLLGFLLVAGLLFLTALVVLAFLGKPNYASWAQLLAFVKLFFQWSVNLPHLVDALRASANALDAAKTASESIAQQFRNAATDFDTAGTKLGEIRIPSLKWSTHPVPNTPFYYVEFHPEQSDAPFGQVQTALDTGRDNMNTAGDQADGLSRALKDTAAGLRSAADVIGSLL